MTAAEALPADPPSFRELVAAEIRAHMARQRLSGRALSRVIERDQTWLSRRLNCAIPIDTDDLELISTALGMAPMELLSGIPARPRTPEGGSPTRWYRPTERHLVALPPLVTDADRHVDPDTIGPDPALALAPAEVPDETHGQTNQFTRVA